ncbi:MULTISPECIES: low molecular weight phosphatase family protein [Nocardiaceae]|uniref:Protein-tyrosine phosphatase n=1 Tax=Rhodococcoides corynebacterioides TaxID=53972 RepID=A0ABS2KZ98_9NOCA|nr:MULTISPECIES: low molecular weight phosphatase family protein [Rhodococcus]MBM7417268.1 protein-tyrosine phosphatase [Rhodococcus corynebacterioides]MBP1115521.1 protein-tyrosine phosphatase [Rhodococcus sp. PvP016]
MHVLYVCTGNICRSPTAERLTAAFARDLKLDVTTDSAGTRAVIGHGVQAEAARVLESLGGDPTGFVARRLTPTIASGADLVLTMTSRHRDEVLTVAPRNLRRTFTLLEAAEFARRTGVIDPAAWVSERAANPVTQLDIMDPIGQSTDVYERVGDAISEALGPLFEIWAAR